MGNFGALPFIYGTLVTSIVSLCITCCCSKLFAAALHASAKRLHNAVPLGLAAAIFLAELAPRNMSDTVAFLIDLLAAVPSVIYGLLGIFVVVPLMRTTIGPFLKHTLGFLPLFKGPNYGVGLLTASMVLAIMIVPFIISVSWARCAYHCPSRSARSGPRLGCHSLGIHLESRRTVGPVPA